VPCAAAKNAAKIIFDFFGLRAARVHKKTTSDAPERAKPGTLALHDGDGVGNDNDNDSGGKAMDVTHGR